jgi:hypothetical protein
MGIAQICTRTINPGATLSELQNKVNKKMGGTTQENGVVGHKKMMQANRPLCESTASPVRHFLSLGKNDEFRPPFASILSGEGIGFPTVNLEFGSLSR